jgi:hypothetical protein
MCPTLDVSHGNGGEELRVDALPAHDCPGLQPLLLLLFGVVMIVLLICRIRQREKIGLAARLRDWC